MASARLTLRIDLGEDRAVGPGKIRLLEAIRDTGSISKAGIALGMSYRRAWLLVDDMNKCFSEPVIAAQVGGSHGGGAALTSFGNRYCPQVDPALDADDATEDYGFTCLSYHAIASFCAWLRASL